MSEHIPLTPQDCLLAVMMAVSASDFDISTTELVEINAQLDYLPSFRGYDRDRVREISAIVLELLDAEEGLDALFGLVRDHLPERLFETAYALACDVAAADGELQSGELRILEEIRHELNVERLRAAAIEWGARVRHMNV